MLDIIKLVNDPSLRQFWYWNKWLFALFVCISLLHAITMQEPLISVGIFSGAYNLPDMLQWIAFIFSVPGFIAWMGDREAMPERYIAISLWLGLLIFPILYYKNYYINGSNFPTIFYLLSSLYCLSVVILLQLIFIAYRYFNGGLSAAQLRFIGLYIQILVVLSLIGPITSDALDFTITFLPDTIDFDVYQIDAAFGHVAQKIAILHTELHPILGTIVYSVYGLLTIFLFLCLGPVLMEKRENQLHIVRVLFVSFLFAIPMYCLNTLSGPVYAFGADLYPFHMPDASQLAYGQQFIPPAPRNGMPSMHFTGSMLMVLVLACLRRKIFFYLACFFSATTFFATMALGEHYLLDLIVAAPFSMALGTGLLNPPGWQFYRRWLWWACVVCFVLWEVYLSIARSILIDYPLFVQLFAIISIIAAITCFVSFLLVVWRLPDPKQRLIFKD